MTKTGLGRGLSELLGDDDSAAQDLSELDKVKQHKIVDISLLAPSPYQPRRSFNPEELDNLVASIKQKGVLQPLLVRRDQTDPNRYEIIAGERRFRASQIAGLSELPVIIKEMNNQEVLEVALVENLQRQDLNAIEEAEGYNRLIDEFSHTQEQLGNIVGKSRSHVANTMRLLSLPTKVRDMVVNGDLTAGHARALITARNPEELADKIVTKGLNVRQVERLARENNKKPKPPALVKSEDVKGLENEISAILEAKVSIKLKEKGGEISVGFSCLEALDTIIKRLSAGGSVSPHTTDDNSVPDADQSLANQASPGFEIKDKSPEDEIIFDEASEQ